jgi:hypothetical protein
VLRRADYQGRRPNITAAEGRAAIVKIERGLNGASLTEVPALPARPLDELRRRVEEAARWRDAGWYRQAADDADGLLIELQIHIATDERRREAAEVLTHAAYNAFVVATTHGYLHLAQQAARRAYDAAMIADYPELDAFSMFALAPAVARAGDLDWAADLLDRQRPR